MTFIKRISFLLCKKTCPNNVGWPLSPVGFDRHCKCRTEFRHADSCKFSTDEIVGPQSPRFSPIEGFQPQLVHFWLKIFRQEEDFTTIFRHLKIQGGEGIVPSISLPWRRHCRASLASFYVVCVQRQRTALHVACEKGSVEVVFKLLEMKSDARQVDKVSHHLATDLWIHRVWRKQATSIFLIPP